MNYKLTDFEKAVLKVIKKIPTGKVGTYRQIAKAIKRPNAFRAVGNALNKNPNAPRLPCHRVVKSDGKIGGYRSGVKKKIALLKKEGIEVKQGKVKDFTKVNYKFYYS